MFFTGFIRKIYDWIIRLSGNRNALMWLFIISFVESSFFPIPPDIMLIPMILATPKEAWKIAGVCTIASVIGAYLGYIIGVYFFQLIAEPLLNFYGYLDKFNEFKNLYEEYGAWIVFGAGITPFPYKIITIASGVVHLNLVVFTIASVIARGLRFFLIAWLLKTYGAKMRIFIEKNLGWLSVLFLVLLFGGFILIKFL
ncbi:MAG: DedA family protein [Alphaproteobacteria bacterium]|nr:DedA family protein [Alphaproteobacteria bacterium]